MDDYLSELPLTKFNLPPKINLPKLENGYEAELRVKEIVDGGVEASLPAINIVLSKLDEDAYDRVQAAANEADADDVPQYLRGMVNTLALAYVGYRTGEAHIREEETGANVTQGYIPIILGELADMLGRQTAWQLYRTLHTSLDTEIERHTGRTK